MGCEMIPVRMGKGDDAMRTGLSLMDAIGKGDGENYAMSFSYGVRLFVRRLHR